MAQYTITINDETAPAKRLVNMAKELARDSKYVIVRVNATNSKAELEAMEDKVLGEMIDEARKSPEISEAEVMNALRL